MPRSHAIWVVTTELSCPNDPPVAAFTVRHELESWLEVMPKTERAWLHIWRMENPRWNNGGRTGESEPARPTEIAMEDLIGCSDPPPF